MGVQALCNLTLNAVEGTATDEQDVAGVNSNIFLVGMLATALRRHVDGGALEQLQQALLHALAAYVAGDAGIILLAGYLVYLVDKHDSALCRPYLIVGHLQQTREDALHILAHIAGLGEDGGVDNGEGHVEQLCNGARHQRLAGAGGSHHDDVRLLYLHAVLLVHRLRQSFIVVVHGYAQIALGFFLTDNILVKIVLYFLRLGYALHTGRRRLFLLCGLHARLLHYLIGLLGTLFADEAVDTRYQQLRLTLAAPAEITCLLHFFASTWSIMPYSFASSAVIQ